MKFEPSTPEEEFRLHQALINGARYEIETKVVVIAIDEEVIFRQAADKIKASTFESEDSRNRILERLRSDTAEAINILVAPHKVVDVEGIACRHSSYKVRKLSNSSGDQSQGGARNSAECPINRPATT